MAPALFQLCQPTANWGRQLSPLSAWDRTFCILVVASRRFTAGDTLRMVQCLPEGMMHKTGRMPSAHWLTRPEFLFSGKPKRNSES